MDARNTVVPARLTEDAVTQLGSYVRPPPTNHTEMMMRKLFEDPCALHDLDFVKQFLVLGSLLAVKPPVPISVVSTAVGDAPTAPPSLMSVETSGRPSICLEVEDKDSKPPVTISGKASSIFAKTKMCPLAPLNLCQKGLACTFAHSEEELRPIPNLRKTRLCRRWARGACKTGDTCQFAHGSLM
eukprot:Platyproteum_vivax@DN6486_c0_g1_i2.p1